MRNTIKRALINWKTSTGGVALGVDQFIDLLEAIRPLTDGNPETVANASLIVHAVVGLVVALSLFFARDADKSSEQSGA